MHFLANIFGASQEDIASIVGVFLVGNPCNAHITLGGDIDQSAFTNPTSLQSALDAIRNSEKTPCPTQNGSKNDSDQRNSRCYG